MLKESTVSALLSAAIAEDPALFGEMNEEELATYNSFVEDLKKAKEKFGDKFDEMEIDIPYSMGDEDDEGFDDE